MKKLLILGTGVHAIEMAEIAERVNRKKKTWKLLGFVSPDESAVGKKLNGYPVVCSKDNLGKYAGCSFVPDNNEWYRKLKIPRKRFVALVDPSSFVSRTAKIGAGTVIYPNCYVGLNANVGNFVFCLSGSTINHDDVIEDNVIIASGVTLAGNLHVESNCYLGQACSVRQYLRIGKGSLVGMGSVVVKNVSPNTVVCGNPARRLRVIKNHGN